jgi:hypothetical protein
MADLTVTAASVIAGTNAITESAIAGETLTAGQVVYKKASDGKYYKAQCDGTTEEAGSGGLGIALHAAGANQPIRFQRGGGLVIGATTVKTSIYCLSATAGGICPEADLVSTNKRVYIGYATDTSGTFVVSLLYTGAVI